MREFRTLGGSIVTLDGNNIKIKNSFLSEECSWDDILDYTITLKKEKNKGTFKIKTKKMSHSFYSFPFKYGINDFRYLYNIFCENCLIHKDNIEMPKEVDVSLMTVFEFSYYNRTTVILDGNFIRINRQGSINVWTHGFAGEKSINISDITAIQLREPGVLSGYLQFTLPGGIEGTRGNSGAIADENAITFASSELAYAIRIKEYVEERMCIDTSVQYSVADEIKKYKQLFDEKAITQEEFEAVKKKLLE